MGYHRLRSLGDDRSTFFDTAALAILGAAYDKAIANLHDRRQPNIVREVIAARIFDPAAKGERDMDRLCAGAIGYDCE